MRARHHAHVAAMTRSLVPFVLVVAAACGDSPTNVSPPQGPPARPTLIAVSGDQQTGEVGAVLPYPLVVALRDTLGAVVSKAMVRFYDEDNVPVDSAATDASGIAAVRWTLGPKASVQQVGVIATVYSGSTGAATATFVVTGVAGPVARVQVTLGRHVALPATQLDTVSARVTDRFDNPIADAQVAWNVETGNGSVRAVTAQTDERGVARAIWTIGPMVGENTLAATVAGVSGRVSAMGSHGFPAVAVVAGATHTCALTTAGEAYCWGNNGSGQLGIGQADYGPHATPAPVVGSLRFTSLAAGGHHTCGLTTTGDAYCWGGNWAGQLGSGSTDGARPAKVPGAFRYSAISTGDQHTCGIADSGIVVCWGDNSLGQLGRGGGRSDPVTYGAFPHPVPGPVVSLVGAVAITAAANSTCAVTNGGAAHCWGGNESGELGDADTGRCRISYSSWYYPYHDEIYDVDCSTVPMRVSTGAAVALSATAVRVCSIAADGELACWGGGNALGPRVVTGARVTTVWTLRDAVCGLDAGDDVSCWALGNPVGFPAVRPFGNRTLVGLAAGSGHHSCGLSRDAVAVVYCWGQNDLGQLGNGTVVHSMTPSPVMPPGRGES